MDASPAHVYITYYSFYQTNKKIGTPLVTLVPGVFPAL